MGKIRITGGTHRSRKIIVEDQPGLRPTGDRARETLFNWLGNNLSGLQVLDLYAGSGILAFEAASRGAAHVTCIDNNRATIMQLRQNLQALDFKSIDVIQQTALNFANNCENVYDLILVDPPFESDQLAAINDIISPLCDAGGYLYREYSIDNKAPRLEEKIWGLKKHKKIGQVEIELWQKNDIYEQ